MRLAGSELFLIVVVLIPTVWAIFDALQTSSEVWAASKQDQAVWVLIAPPSCGRCDPVLSHRTARLNQVR